MQAAWLLTTALGDVIVVIVAGVKLLSQVTHSLASVTHCMFIQAALNA